MLKINNLPWNLMKLKKFSNKIFNLGENIFYSKKKNIFNQKS